MRVFRTTGLLIAMGIVAMALSSCAGPQDSEDDQAARLEAALASPERSDENRARDATRKPVEVIRFLGIETGDSVLDVIAAGGWYTEVLSAAVGPEGHVYSQNPDFFVNRPGFAEEEQALVDRLGNVTPVHGDLPQTDVTGQVDAAITALNLHDIYNMGGEAAALGLLQGIFASLRSGGVFGVIDHRGMAGQPNAEFHRLEEAIARDLLERAGFTVEASSDLLANPADDHMRSVRDESLARNTDRFLLRARKP